MSLAGSPEQESDSSKSFGPSLRKPNHHKRRMATADVLRSWSTKLIQALLDYIAESPIHKQTLLSQGSAKLPIWEATRDICIGFFTLKKETIWLMEQKTFGRVDNVNGEWKATRQWDSKYNDPVKTLLKRLVNDWRLIRP